jgi:hypothetical protein
MMNLLPSVFLLRILTIDTEIKTQRRTDDYVYEPMIQDQYHALQLPFQLKRLGIEPARHALEEQTEKSIV